MNGKNVFIHESSDIPEMIELREKYQLKKIISNAKTEFEKFIKLRSLVQQCWKYHGYDQVPEKNNSLKILEAAEKGRNFECWYYATVFVQCAVSLGFKARRLGIGIHPSVERPGSTGHIVAEIWSNEFQKWIVMDADINAHYEKDGVPLNALELHNLWVTQRLGDIKYIQGKPVPKIISKYTPEEKATKFVFGAYNVVDYYFRLQVEMRNNWFSSGEATKPFTGIAWIDKYHPSYSERNGKIIDNVFWTDISKNIYWDEKK